MAYTFLGAPTTSNSESPRPDADHLLALLAGVELGSPRPAQGWHASLFGGPSISISNTSGDTKLGIEAGVVLGYRWRTLDISVGLGYDRDPKREAGERDVFSGTVNLDVFSLFRAR